MEDHFVELDSNAKKIQLKSNKSVEAVCITNQTVVQFKHHKTEQIKPNQKEQQPTDFITQYNFEHRGGSIR